MFVKDIVDIQCTAFVQLTMIIHLRIHRLKFHFDCIVDTTFRNFRHFIFRSNLLRHSFSGQSCFDILLFYFLFRHFFFDIFLFDVFFFYVFTSIQIHIQGNAWYKGSHYYSSCHRYYYKYLSWFDLKERKKVHCKNYHWKKAYYSHTYKIEKYTSWWILFKKKDYFI
jgi:hypothetical protein